jgi:hypothetical protein
MKLIKLIALSIVLMLVIGIIAYFIITGDVEDTLDEILNPPCETTYVKNIQGGATEWHKDQKYSGTYVIWRNRLDGPDELEVAWADWPRAKAFQSYDRMKLQYRANSGESWHTIFGETKPDLDDDLHDVSGWMIGALKDNKHLMVIDDNELWDWTLCMLSMVHRGDA